jgi:hypothetical protein
MSATHVLTLEIDVADPQHRWIKAKSSLSNGACVELTIADGDTILVRNSRHPEVCISYTRAELDAFFQGVKDGEFDNLVNDS